MSKTEQGESMNTYERCLIIRRRLLNRAAEVMVYSWDNDFAVRRIREIPSQLLGDDDFVGIQVGELSKEQMDNLEFGVWENGSPMRLIPLWLFPFLPEELECTCINGESGTTKKSDMDNDHRFGCLAYGVIPSC